MEIDDDQVDTGRAKETPSKRKLVDSEQNTESVRKNGAAKTAKHEQPDHQIRTEAGHSGPHERRRLGPMTLASRQLLKDDKEEGTMSAEKVNTLLQQLERLHDLRRRVTELIRLDASVQSAYERYQNYADTAHQENHEMTETESQPPPPAPS